MGLQDNTEVRRGSFKTMTPAYAHLAKKKVNQATQLAPWTESNKGKITVRIKKEIEGEEQL